MNTANKGLAQPANNSFIGTWDIPMNSNFGIIDQCFGGIGNFNVAAGNITLLAADLQHFLIQLNGVLGSSILLVFPVGLGGMFVVNNAATGAFLVTATVSGSPGTQVNLPQGRPSLIYSDGTNISSPSPALRGTQAWWYVDSALGAAITSGFASVTNPGKNNSTFTFSTPQPDANYCVNMTPYITTTAANNYGCIISNQTAFSFTIISVSATPGASQLYNAVSVVR